jgi:hypothetical protein
MKMDHDEAPLLLDAPWRRCRQTAAFPRWRQLSSSLD